MPVLAWLLNSIYVALLLVYVPFRWVVRRKGIAGWKQKFLGQVPLRSGARPCLWLHAVSVGEVVQLQSILRDLSSRHPELEVVISTTTPTGYDVARQRYAQHSVFYFPFDFSWAVNAALSRINPTAIALVELELWPNFVLAAAKREIPLALINGRITERSFRGYSRIRPLMRTLLRKLSVVAVQSELYATRLINLGADPAQMHITGSIKFDGVETQRSHPRTAALREYFGLRDDEVVFIAGSTQDPEERYALESYQTLRARDPRLRLILVPRHKERFDEVARLVTGEFRLPLVRRSGQAGADTTRSTPPDTPPVLLLDTLGELSYCWGLADIAFVGGSLTQRGGQNMIEPAGFGAAVLFGPNTWNFKDVVELLLTHDAARVVHSGAELTFRLAELLADADGARQLGHRARDLVTAQAGATGRTVELLAGLLPEPPRWQNHAA
ncbi:MAG: 3-deoxy-D-manno-octulosonic acid transferase [Planctomycetes bacterium]|nr:3-deoxy-D-manno-octulosonic acid transferase [Planctomycetota bacterium]